MRLPVEARTDSFGRTEQLESIQALHPHGVIEDRITQPALESLELCLSDLPRFDARAFREGHLSPVIFGSALKDFGVAELLACLARWAPDALRLLVRNFADPDVAYVCGGHRYETTLGTNRESTYWRYESWLRRSESALGSITGGIGPIYAVRRSDYIENEPRFGHDLGFPYLMAQRGRRAVYEPAAMATEKPSHNLEDEYHRKVRMLAQSWLHVLSGRMLRGGGPLYLTQIVSHRLLRYGSGILHLCLLGANIALVGDGVIYSVALGVQVTWLALAAAGRRRLPLPGAGLAYYYFLVTLATLAGLVRYLRFGVPVVWEKAEGTR